MVRACLEAGSHYMDISGEPQFMENMFLKYAFNSHVIYCCVLKESMNL